MLGGLIARGLMTALTVKWTVEWWFRRLAGAPAEWEERCWLYRVAGSDPRGDRLVVYTLSLLAKSPDLLRAEAGFLCGDPRFRAEEAWAERLPLLAGGHVVLDLSTKQVLASAVPEEERRGLEEWSAGRVRVVVLEAGAVGLRELAGLRERLREAGARVVKIRNLYPFLVFELSTERPPTREERERLRELIVEEVPALRAPPELRAEEELLESAGLGALAQMVPKLWKLYSDGEPRRWSREGKLPLWVKWKPARALEGLLPKRVRGERGEFELHPDLSTYLYLREVGDRELELMGELVAADEACRRWEEGQRRLARRVEEAERRAMERLLGLPEPGPIAGYIEEFLVGDPTKLLLLEEGGRVRALVSPTAWRGMIRFATESLELATELLRSLGGSTRGGRRPRSRPTAKEYLRILAEEVELVKGRPPVPPEPAETAERALRAISELVGAKRSP